MCGIGGYYAFGTNRPEIAKVERLFKAMEARGTDASGAAWYDGSSLQIAKSVGRTSEVIKKKDWKVNVRAMPQWMMLHTRMATKGSKEKNLNNHPIFSKNGVCIVHNGIISNDDEVFQKLKAVRDGEVDSEAILRVVESEKSWGKAVKKCGELLAGSYAVAAWDIRRPKELALFRNSSPIVWHMDVEEDILYWASTKGILEAMTTIKHRGFVLSGGPIQTQDLPDEYALVVGPKGVKQYFEFDARGAYEVPTNTWSGTYSPASSAGFGSMTAETDWGKYKPLPIQRGDIPDTPPSKPNEPFFCGECFTELKETDKECPNCGEKFNLRDENWWLE